MADHHVTVAIFNERTGWTLPRAHIERIKDAAGANADVMAVTSRRALLEALPHTQSLIGFPITEEVFTRVGSSVNWVQMTSSSGDSIGSLTDAVMSGLRLTTAATVRAPQIAEHAIALTLAMIRRIDRAIRSQQEHRWSTSEIADGIGALQGSTIGLVSIGPLGHELATRLKAFGVHLIALQHPLDGAYFDADMSLPFSQIDELMMRSDVVIVATPRLPAIEGLIGRRQLRKMKRTAMLVNVSRGGVVDEEALLDALHRNRLAGAGLDVFEHEPLPTSSPFWTMPNVIVTPHVGAASPHYWQRAVDHICHNLTRLRQDRPLLDELTAEWLTRSIT